MAAPINAEAQQLDSEVSFVYKFFWCISFESDDKMVSNWLKYGEFGDEEKK